MRINEPFGDVVNWDLLPQSAIASIQLIPGSNPLFGLNTGGALAIPERARFPGGSVELSGGSFGRVTLQVEQGGMSGPWDYYVRGNVSGPRLGRAQPEPDRAVLRGVGYETERDNVDIHLTTADNRLKAHQPCRCRSWTTAGRRTPFPTSTEPARDARFRAATS